MTANNRRPDYQLLVIVFLLVIIGLIILSSASVVVSQNSFNNSYHFLIRQLIYSLPLGLLGFFIFFKIKYQTLQKISFPLLIISIILLGLVFVPGLGYSNDGVRRWISIGELSFQPFELVKLTFIIYFSALLSRNKNQEKALKESVLPTVIIVSIIGLMLISQPNLSALIMLFFITATIYFLAKMRLSYIFFIIIAIMLLCGVLAKTAPYRMARLTIFMHPELDPQGIGYQVRQAHLAIGSGGLFGLGLGHSIQKWQYLPEVVGDSIFAIAAEELGFIGAGVLVILFILFAWRGIKIAKQAPDNFGYLMAGSITVWIFFQAFVNIGAISGLLPLTGMPLPFISYGGSSLIVILTGTGLLANISKQ